MLTYEGERDCSSFMAFLAANCQLRSGSNLLDAQFAAYAQRHQLQGRLRASDNPLVAQLCAQ